VTGDNTRDDREGLVKREVPPFGVQQFLEPQAELTPIEGGYLMTSPRPLPELTRTTVDYLRRSAAGHPDRVALADHFTNEDWRRITYGEALAKVNSIAQALLDRGIGPHDVVAIIGPNSIDQALMMFGAQTVGAAVAPISLAYAMFPEARERLHGTFAKAAPKLLFVQDGPSMAAALAELDLAGAELVSVAAFDGATPFAELTAVEPTEAVEEAFAAIEPDWVGKLLFTSGSTGIPKAVPNTHRMMTANLEQMMAVRMRDANEPGIILDWLPWHHTFGGNVVLAESIADAATLYIDDGKPVPGPMFQKTVDAVKEIRPTFYNCVPAGLGMLADAMDNDKELRDAFFERLTIIRYGGAGLSQAVFDKLESHAEAATGKRVPALTAYAMTEASPGATLAHWPVNNSANCGVPLPGCELKLLDLGEDRFEVRLRGPNIFPGYLDEPAINAEAFDEDGFFKTGDVLRLIDKDNPSAGVAYDGRVSEDFKLETGTWVNVGQIRADLLEAFGPQFWDAVITGDRKPFVGAMVWLRKVPEGVEVRDGVIVPDAALRERVLGLLGEFNARNTASSRRIGKLVLLADPPRLEAGEINDKQYINQRAVVKLRADIVARIYDDVEDDACLSC